MITGLVWSGFWARYSPDTKKQVILSDPINMPQKQGALPPNSQSYGEMLPERAEALPASVVRSRC